MPERLNGNPLLLARAVLLSEVQLAAYTAMGLDVLTVLPKLKRDQPADRAFVTHESTHGSGFKSRSCGLRLPDMSAVKAAVEGTRISPHSEKSGHPPCPTVSAPLFPATPGLPSLSSAPFLLDVGIERAVGACFRQDWDGSCGEIARIARHGLAQNLFLDNRCVHGVSVNRMLYSVHAYFPLSIAVRRFRRQSGQKPC